MNEEEEINTIIIYLEAKIDDAFKKAELVKEEYLAKWVPTRKYQLHKKRADQNYIEAEVGRMIPRVRMNSEKAYIEWTDQNSPKIKRINKKFSLSVTPHKTKGYTKEILKKNSDNWELELVIEFEERFKPIRKTMNAMHEAKIKLKSINRLYYTNKS